MNFTSKEKEYEIDDDLYNFCCAEVGITDTRAVLPALLDKKIYLSYSILGEYLSETLDVDEEEREDIASIFKIKGTLDIPVDYDESHLEEIEESFRIDKRFRGRVPGIVKSIARVYSLYNELYPEMYNDPSDFVFRFNINNVKNMIDAGIPEMQAVMLYYHYDIGQCANVISHPNISENICNLLYNGVKNKDESLKVAADWIIGHGRSNERIISKVTKKAGKIKIDKDLSVEAMEAVLSEEIAKKEIKKIQKAYKRPGWKFKDTVCELKDVGKKVFNEKYASYIMEPLDKRQVILGLEEASHCCQKFGDAGESAMMHGLINPKAGFWIVEDKNTHDIKCQAEVWEESENTLVFDNIELANDAELALYQPILSSWLQATSYTNVKMGTGYNAFMHNGEFRSSGAVKPTITPYEAYVLSYEDDSYCEGVACKIESEEKAKELLDAGRISYFDYVYCDSENNAMWLKENNVLEPYFEGLSEDIKRLIENTKILNNPIITRYINFMFDANIPIERIEDAIDEDVEHEDDNYEDDYEEDDYEEDY